MELPEFTISLQHDGCVLSVDNNKDYNLSNYVSNFIANKFLKSQVTHHTEDLINIAIEKLLHDLVLEGRLFKQMDGWHFVSEINLLNEAIAIHAAKGQMSQASAAYYVCEVAFAVLQIKDVHAYTSLDLEILHASIINYARKHYSKIHDSDLITQAHNVIFNKRTEHAITYGNSITKSTKHLDKDSTPF